MEGRVADEKATETQFSLEDTFDETQAKRLRGVAEFVTSALTRTDSFTWRASTGDCKVREEV